MQAPNAQGIMGLMAQGKTPQQPQQPMPSPMKASPMAGLGSVEDRVAAYRGNPAPLQQRYQMSQDLLDLLALQKIKSEKDAAARQMQLAMGQQQAAQGEVPMTVAQQREKEVHDLTKAELAQQRGDTAGQQMQQQQDAMKRALSGGIAAAPGAGAAAQPKAMAAGGIVAFDEGGSTDKEVQRILSKDPHERTPEENAMLERSGIKLQRQQIPENSFVRRLDTMLGGGGDRSRQLNEERARNMQIVNAEGANLRPTMQNDPRLLGATPPQETVAAPAAGPTPAPAPAATPRPTPAPGIAGLPQAAAAPGYGQEMNQIMLQQARRDDRAEGLADEARVEKKLAPPEEQLQAIRDANAFRKREFESQYDPERQRQEGLIRFLTGAGGRRYGELGAGAQAAQGYDASQRAAKLKEFEDMQKGIMQPFDLQRAAAKEGISAGQAAAKNAGESQRSGIAGLYHQYGTDVGSRDKALDREVEKLKINLQAESNKIQREGLDLSKAQATYSAAMGRVQELERKLDQDFAKQYGMLLMAEQGGKMEPAQKQQLEVARAALDVKKDAIRKELEPVLASTRAKLGITSPTSLTPEEEAAIKRNANRGK